MGGNEKKFPISSILSFRILDVKTETNDGKVRSENSLEIRIKMKGSFLYMKSMTNYIY